MKKIIYLVIILAVILGGAYLLQKKSALIDELPISNFPVATSTNFTESEKSFINLILNSNGFVDGKKTHGPFPDEGPSFEEILKGQVVFGDLNNDGKDEAVAPIRYCAASCGLGVYLFIFDQNNVTMSRVPNIALAGVDKDIKPIRIENGVVGVTQTMDGKTWWTDQFKMVNKVLVKI